MPRQKPPAGEEGETNMKTSATELRSVIDELTQDAQRLLAVPIEKLSKSVFEYIANFDLQAACIDSHPEARPGLAPGLFV